MIHYIKGILEAKTIDSIVVDNQGIGYQIRVPLSVLDRMPPCGNEVKIYTYMHVREDLLQLFGFLREDDLRIFKLLITVNGIGPKGGLAILSTMTSDELRFAVIAEDAKTIAKTPGIGAKTAGKLILELKDKIHIEEMLPEGLQEDDTVDISDGQSIIDGEEKKQMISDAVEALTALGYRAADAMKAVRKVPMTEDMTIETLLKLSLKNMG